MSSPIDSIREPRDYYDGASAAFTDLPERINVFTRHKDLLCSGDTARHHRYNLVFCLAGSTELVSESGRHTLSAGRQILVRPFDRHCYVRCSDDVELLIVGFEQPSRSIDPLVAQGPCDTTPASTGLLKMLFSSARLQSEEAAGADGNALAPMVLLLLREMFTAEGNESTLSQRFCAEGLAAWIDRHVSAVHTVAGMARELGYSESGLRRKARAEAGVSVGRLLAERKMKAAMELLTRTALPIAEISAYLGYPHPGSFSRAFKQRVGVTPRAFRRAAERRPVEQSAGLDRHVPRAEEEPPRR
jgi:AraC-like DNA-binding protein